MNLDAYLRHIDYHGQLTPTLDVLRDLAFHHATRIPFENLNPLLGLPVSLDPLDVEHKLVGEGRGGYCFEQNLLLSEALRAVGFQVTGLAARVLWMRAETDITPRSHMVLRVDVDDRIYLVDVGFGALTLTGAVELTADIEQSTPHEPFRLTRLDDNWFMQAQLGDNWKTLYRFDLQRQYPQDYEVANHFTATHPESHFLVNLLAARPTADGRYALRNRELTFHRSGGGSESRTLKSAEEICATLERDFKITLPRTAQLRERLDSLP